MICHCIFFPIGIIWCYKALNIKLKLTRFCSAFKLLLLKELMDVSLEKKNQNVNNVAMITFLVSLEPQKLKSSAAPTGQEPVVENSST